MTTIEYVDGQIVTPLNPTILFIEGDGIGVDIWTPAQNVFDKAVEVSYSGGRKVDWVEVLAGEKAFTLTGEWLPDDTVEKIKENLVAIKGPLATPTGGGHRSLNVTLRQQLDLFACVRPIEYFPGVPAPVVHPENVNMVLFRENTEDIYAGIEWAAGSDDAYKFSQLLKYDMGVEVKYPFTTGYGVKPISEQGSKRLIRAALEYAVTHNRKTVTIVHKGNIQKFTEGAFLKWGREVVEQEYQKFVDYGVLTVNDIIADNFFQQALLRPEIFDVVAFTNLNGDYASDAVAAQVGGIGIAPGGNINYKTGHAIFEATHGTAPDIAGLGVANPCSLLLSGAQMFDYLGWSEPAELIRKSIREAFKNNQVTGDFARLLPHVTPLTTQQFTDVLIKNLR